MDAEEIKKFFGEWLVAFALCGFVSVVLIPWFVGAISILMWISNSGR
jgi:hypothetical protein